MDIDVLYCNNCEYTYFLSFDRYNIYSLLELELDNFGGFLNSEQWASLLIDHAIILNSERDKQAIYLLQLGVADIISPIRKDFMKMYLQFNQNRGQKKVG